MLMTSFLCSWLMLLVILMLNIFASLFGGQVHFLHEFCSLSKSLQMVQQLRLFWYVASGVVNLDNWQCQPVMQFVFSNFLNQLLLFDCILGNYLGRACYFFSSLLFFLLCKKKKSLLFFLRNNLIKHVLKC